MKKCASCSKDLPDAALHCVFCGAKQAPAPAAQPGNAKTVMGYSSNEVIEQLKAQQAAQRAAQPAPMQPPPMQPPPMQPPPMQPPPMQPPSMAPPGMSAHGPTMLAPPVQPHNLAQASTVFIENAGPPPGMLANNAAVQPTMVPPPPAPAPYVPPPMQTPYVTPPAYQQPQQPVPVAHAVAPAVPPYLASQTAARAGRPIEPWKDTLRLVMFVFGGLLVAAFAVPLRTDPMVFNWDAIIHGEGVQKIGPLLIAAVGVLSIVFAAIPMATGPRGILAAILGLAGGLVPMLVGGMPEWPVLSTLVGLVLLIPGLVVRSEYRDASLPRILVTVGAIGVLLPFLVPMHGNIGIVMLFEALMDAPGGLKVIIGLELGFLAIVALSLLAWLPAPASGGAKLFAWLLILWGAVVLVGGLLISGHIGDVVSGAPYTLVSWIAGGGLGEGGGAKDAALLLGFPCAYGALIGYGLATVFGKQLE